MFRAAWLAGLAGGALAGSSVVLPRQAHSMVVAGRQRSGTPVEIEKIRWGEDPERQSGQLYLPDPIVWSGGDRRPTYPVMVFFHGGGWTDTSGPEYCQAAARDLACYGVAVWMPTYRGTPSPGGWPMTFDDAADGLDFVRELGAHADFTPNLERVHVTGHSAGGQLAAWVSARNAFPAGTPGAGSGPSGDRVRVRSVTALSAVLDLDKAVTEDDDHWALDVMGGRPDEHPDRYRRVSPLRGLPSSVPVNVLHGRADSTVPVNTLRDYLKRHAQTGNTGRVILLDGAEHNDFVALRNRAWAVAREVCLSSVGTQEDRARTGATP
ncbi:alpha/beta hydrolase [Kocuria soli]|uniref:Alpha/beta hydrolase n=1 Tax=Kocuria soli TaxID=2485125 RepID=A0A3N3ZRW6_9MICC|nr:alpha/beta hydrolase [Kocuria soli]ROZ62316.1 alpha/beta hydrolase [Kocuria soli]